MPHFSSTISLLFILLTSFVTGESLAQSSPILERKISLEANERILSQVMKEMEAKAGFTFSYRSELVDGQRLVNARFRNQPVREILAALFGRKLNYKERGNFLILSANRPDEGPKKKVDGYLLDGQGNGVPNATIFDPITLISSNTNDYGYYSLRLDSTESATYLEVRKSSFRDTIIPLETSSVMLHSMFISSDTTFHRKWLMARDSARVKFSRWTDRMFPDRIELSNVEDTIYRNVQVSFVPYVGTNRKLSGQVINRTSFNAIAGYSRGVDGFELGGAANLVREDVRGVQIAGALNLVGGRVKGVQVAGFSNLSLGYFDGVGIGGFSNYFGSGGNGVSVSGFATVSRGYFEGVSVSGFSNVLLREANGVLISGFSNVVYGSSGGLQMAGFGNVVSRDMNGVQAAGFINVVGQRMSGAQVSGFLNVAKEVEGTQVGVFNYCDTISGVPVGFLSFVRKGYHPFELSTNDLGMIDIAWRTGVRSFHTFLSAGLNPASKNQPLPWQFGYGIGTSPRLGGMLFLNVDLSSHHLSLGDFSESRSLDNRLSALFEIQLPKKVSFFGGPCLHGFLDHTNRPDLREELGIPSRLLSEDTNQTLRMSTWLGWRAGIRIG